MLQEYAVGEKNQEEFRKLRVRDSQAIDIVLDIERVMILTL